MSDAKPPPDGAPARIEVAGVLKAHDLKPGWTNLDVGNMPLAEIVAQALPVVRDDGFWREHGSVRITIERIGP